MYCYLAFTQDNAFLMWYVHMYVFLFFGGGALKLSQHCSDNTKYLETVTDQVHPLLPTVCTFTNGYFKQALSKKHSSPQNGSRNMTVILIYFTSLHFLQVPA